MNDKSKNIKLFVGNLPYDASESDLRDLLEGCGNIRFILIRKDKQTNKSKGYAHVEYRHESEAVEAFKRLLGKEILGRVLKVDFCDGDVRSRYPELVNAASVFSQNGLVTPESPSTVPVEESAVEPPSPDKPGPCSYPNVQQDLAVLLGELSEKRERSEEEMLISDNGSICNSELFGIVKNMTMLDVSKTVEVIDELMAKSLINARYILQSNRRMETALIHAKMLLGHINMESKRLYDERNELNAAFEYFRLD
ncbi:Cleavage stimulating factor 64 [Babesia sp. Xinjiang]|uniref:Cleavage stimulating factor 64 n=1 Tax=Babesia sp. Xinjiang TaxID=462227 RepID=UPI000A26424C|nr:Cleavage stimulating factor 64 [Babesia sp. Xinjiang]ORM42308.1 Cleavage stimulating factor 64 [Babesia sp. Xinjiang]